MNMVWVRALIILLVINSLITQVAFGDQGTDKTVVIHVTTVPADDASRYYSIARLTITALDEGQRVIMLYDGDGAEVVRLGSWYGGDTTLLDKLDIPDAEQESLAGSLGLTKASTPSNYGDLMRLLRGKGVELYVSGDMMRHHKITDDKYDNVFIPIEPARMLEIFDRADVYLSY
jgi:hypothetical protein